jgi:cytochrome c
MPDIHRPMTCRHRAKAPPPENESDRTGDLAGGKGATVFASGMYKCKQRLPHASVAMKRVARELAMLQLRLSASLILAVVCGCWTSSAFAEGGLPDRAQGRTLAERFCSGCHSISPDQQVRGSERGPSFSSLAEQPGLSREKLAAALSVPHPEMPAVSLSSDQLRDIVEYILSLKRHSPSPNATP